MLFCCIKNKSQADFSRFFFLILISLILVLSLCQIELEEQRRTSRGRAKDSRRKRKGHRGGSGDGAGERSLDASESKKTCPLSHSPSHHLSVQTHPEVICLAFDLSKFMTWWDFFSGNCSFNANIFK